MPSLRLFPRTRGALGVALILSLALMFAALACGGAEETPAAPAPSGQTTAPAPAAQTQTLATAAPAAPAAPVVAELKGTIEIDGSSTVFPVSEAVAEEFGKLHPDVRVNVGVSGTGGGFKRFTVGETDISDASRPIKDGEAAAAEENGIEYYPLRVAMDGLSVMVSPDNDFVECLTTDQLKMIWEPGSTVEKWSDVDPSWPSSDIALYGPDTDSGTFDYFTEEIMGEAQLSRADYTASADDNVLVQGIAGGKYSLGYFGFAYYQENVDKLKLVAVDSGNGCVLPTSESIENGTYSPLSRPLFIYVSAASMERPEVKAFVEFYLDNAAELSQEVGYIRLGDAEYAANRSMIQGPPPEHMMAMEEKKEEPAVMVELKGTIEIDGSSTVFPVSEAVAEEFGKIHSDVRVNVGVSGTGGGFKRFTVGETDISDASRPIKDAEAQQAADNGIEYYPLRVAMDGLSVMVSPENDFVECLSTDQLKMIWEPESTVEKWSDVDPSWPDSKIALYGPDTDSGTFDYFTEEIMGEAQVSRADYTASADDNVLVQGIAGGKYSLGYFGYAYYQENMDKLKLVAVDSGNGCVLPNSESIENGTYSPLSRPLFIYVSKQSMERPEVKAFVEFYLDNAAELSQEVGYIKLGDAEYASNREAIKQ